MVAQKQNIFMWELLCRIFEKCSPRWSAFTHGWSHGMKIKLNTSDPNDECCWTPEFVSFHVTEMLKDSSKSTGFFWKLLQKFLLKLIQGFFRKIFHGLPQRLVHGFLPFQTFQNKKILSIFSQVISWGWDFFRTFSRNFSRNYFRNYSRNFHKRFLQNMQLQEIFCMMIGISYQRFFSRRCTLSFLVKW